MDSASMKKIDLLLPQVRDIVVHRAITRMISEMTVPVAVNGVGADTQWGTTLTLEWDSANPIEGNSGIVNVPTFLDNSFFELYAEA